MHISKKACVRIFMQFFQNSQNQVTAYDQGMEDWDGFMQWNTAQQCRRMNHQCTQHSQKYFVKMK